MARRSETDTNTDTGFDGDVVLMRTLPASQLGLGRDLPVANVAFGTGALLFAPRDGKVFGEEVGEWEAADGQAGADDGHVLLDDGPD